MVLTPRKATSYELLGEPAELIAHLTAHGYRPIEQRSAHEAARLRRGPALIVIYHTGTVLLQGDRPDDAHAVLAPLVATKGAA